MSAETLKEVQASVSRDGVRKSLTVTVSQERSVSPRPGPEAPSPPTSPSRSRRLKPPHEEREEEVAARKVQAHVRGHFARKKVQGMKKKKAPAKLKRVRTESGYRYKNPEEEAAVKIQSHFRGHATRKRSLSSKRKRSNSMQGRSPDKPDKPARAGSPAAAATPPIFGREVKVVQSSAMDVEDVFGAMLKAAGTRSEAYTTPQQKRAFKGKAFMKVKEVADFVADSAPLASAAQKQFMLAMFAATGQEIIFLSDIQEHIQESLQALVAARSVLGLGGYGAGRKNTPVAVLGGFADQLESSRAKAQAAFAKSGPKGPRGATVLEGIVLFFRGLMAHCTCRELRLLVAYLYIADEDAAGHTFDELRHLLLPFAHEHHNLSTSVLTRHSLDTTLYASFDDIGVDSPGSQAWGGIQSVTPGKGAPASSPFGRLDFDDGLRSDASSQSPVPPARRSLDLTKSPLGQPAPSPAPEPKLSPRLDAWTDYVTKEQTQSKEKTIRKEGKKKLESMTVYELERSLPETSPLRKSIVAMKVAYASQVGMVQQAATGAQKPAKAARGSPAKKGLPVAPSLSPANLHLTQPASVAAAPPKLDPLAAGVGWLPGPPATDFHTEVAGIGSQLDSVVSHYIRSLEHTSPPRGTAPPAPAPAATPSTLAGPTAAPYASPATQAELFQEYREYQNPLTRGDGRPVPVPVSVPVPVTAAAAAPPEPPVHYGPPPTVVLQPPPMLSVQYPGPLQMHPRYVVAPPPAPPAAAWPAQAQYAMPQHAYPAPGPVGFQPQALQPYGPALASQEIEKAYNTTWEQFQAVFPDVATQVVEM